MDAKGLTKAWIATAISLLVLSVNGMSVTLGWGLSLHGLLGAESVNRSTTAWAVVYFVPWAFLETVLLILTFELARRCTRVPRWLYVPSLAGRLKNANDPFGRRVHASLLFLVATAPLYAGGHFLRKTLIADVVCDSAVVVHEWFEHFTARAPTTCWLDGPGAGVEYFPPLEAWALVAVFGVVIAAWIRLLLLWVSKS